MADTNEQLEASPAAKDRTKPRPKKSLPTDRIAFSKQIEILRAYAVGSPDGSKSLTNTDISTMVGIHQNSVSLCNGFFVESGLLQRGGENGLTPASDVLAYGRTLEWDKDSAPEKLAPTLQRTWFAEAILPRAALRVLTEAEALTVLAEAASADKSYRSQLLLLLEYLDFAKLILRDGTNIRRATRLASFSAPAPPVAEEIRPSTSSLTTQADSPRIQYSNGVNFSVDINVDMAELSGWSADRITAFFQGLAQVIAAKGSAQSKAERRD